jgi:hypothetical protein
MNEYGFDLIRSQMFSQIYSKHKDTSGFKELNDDENDCIFIMFTHILYFYLFIFTILIIYVSVALLVRRTAQQRRMQQVVLGVVWSQPVRRQLRRPQTQPQHHFRRFQLHAISAELEGHSAVGCYTLLVHECNSIRRRWHRIQQAMRVCGCLLCNREGVTSRG